MDDLIYKQVAIDALMTWEEDSFRDEECLKHRGEPFWVSPSDVIEKLPSAEQERREAHWIDAGWDGDLNWQIDGRGNCWHLWRCSHCFAESKKASKFCPECGFKMIEMPEVEE